MCGICGIAFSDCNRPISRELLAAMTALMHHRGPDSRGHYLADGIGLGVCRLSIIDVDNGDQPISNEDESISLVCNGEIYNFVELREELEAGGHRFRTGSDVETIVHLYEDLGAQCVHRLRGMFAFALWDRGRRLLLLARDRLGIKPLYCAQRPEGLCFGSEIKPIILAGWGGAPPQSNAVGTPSRPRLDMGAFRDLFAFGHVLGPGTLFAGVRQLLPGHYLLCRDGQVNEHRYWQPSFPPRDHLDSNTDAQTWAQGLLEKLRETVRIHLRSDVPVGAWLSAGIDSSTIAGLASGLTDHPIRTFSLAFENPDFDEVSRQKTLDCFPQFGLRNERAQCRTEDFNLFPKAMWHCENVSSAGTELLAWILARSTAPHVKVALTGEGSDEVLGGYGWFRVDKLLRPMAGLPLPLRRLMLLGPLMPRLWPGASRVHVAPKEMNVARYQSMIGPKMPELADPLFSEEVRRQIRDSGGSEQRWATPPEFQQWHPFNQLQYYELTVRLPNYIVHQLDCVSMAHSVEARVPFLDHELVEFCARIPPSLKMRRLTEKYILRLATRGFLPREIAWRRKQPLRAPRDQWLRCKLPDFAAEMLSEKALRDKGYFHPPAVEELLRRHRSGQGQFGAHLLAVLAIQVWDELFVSGRFQRAPS